MVQLCILSGPMAGSLQVVRRFPFRIGRTADNDLCLDATGVWDHHFMLNLQRNEGFGLQTCDKALATVNDHPQSSTLLKNGDVISFGSVKVQFWLSDPTQRGLGARELFFWTLLILVTLGQAVLVYILLGLG